MADFADTISRGAELTFELDWADAQYGPWLGAGENIIDLAVEVKGLELVSSSFTNSVTRAKVRCAETATLGLKATIKFKITTNAASVNKDSRYIQLKVTDRIVNLRG